MSPRLQRTCIAGLAFGSTLHCLRSSLVRVALFSPSLVTPLPASQNWDLEYRDSDEAKQATKHIRFLFENYEPKYDGAGACVPVSCCPPRSFLFALPCLTLLCSAPFRLAVTSVDATRYWFYEVIERWRLVLVACFGLLLLEGSSTQLVFVLLVNIAAAVLALKVQVLKCARV